MKETCYEGFVLSPLPSHPSPPLACCGAPSAPSTVMEQSLGVSHAAAVVWRWGHVSVHACM